VKDKIVVKGARTHNLKNITVILAGDEMILATETTIQKVWLPQEV